MADEGVGKPVAILKWFYPGTTAGHEFAYSEPEREQLAQDRQQTIVTKGTAEAGD